MPVLANFSVRIAVVFLAALVYAGGHQTASLPEQALVVSEKEENRTFSDERTFDGPHFLESKYVIADFAVAPSSRAVRENDLLFKPSGPRPFPTGPPEIRLSQYSGD